MAVAAIHQRRRIGAMAEGELAHELVDLQVGRPGLTMSVSSSRRCAQRAGPAHAHVLSRFAHAAIWPVLHGEVSDASI